MLVFFFCFRLIFLPLWAFFDAAIACGWILLYLATMIYMKRYYVITRCIQFLKMKFLYLYYTLDEWNAMEHIIAERFCLLRFLYISLRITWIIHASAEFRKAFFCFFCFLFRLPRALNMATVVQCESQWWWKKTQADLRIKNNINKNNKQQIEISHNKF